MMPAAAARISGGSRRASAGDFAGNQGSAKQSAYSERSQVPGRRALRPPRRVSPLLLRGLFFLLVVIVAPAGGHGENEAEGRDQGQPHHPRQELVAGLRSFT